MDKSECDGEGSTGRVFLCVNTCFYLLHFHGKETSFHQKDRFRNVLASKDGNICGILSLSSIYQLCKKSSGLRISNTCVCLLLHVIYGEVESNPSLITDKITAFCCQKEMKLFHQNIRRLHWKYDILRGLLIDSGEVRRK